MVSVRNGNISPIEKTEVGNPTSEKAAQRPPNIIILSQGAIIVNSIPKKIRFSPCCIV